MSQLPLDPFAILGMAPPPEEQPDTSPPITLEAMERDVLDSEKRKSRFAPTLRDIYERRKARESAACEVFAYALSLEEPKCS